VARLESRAALSIQTSINVTCCQRMEEMSGPLHDCSLSLSHELPLSDQVPETVCPAPNGAPPRTHIRRGPGRAPNQPTAEDHLGFHVREWGRGPEVRGARAKLAEVRPAGLWLGGRRDFEKMPEISGC
jgi:hypothetical protein